MGKTKDLWKKHKSNKVSEEREQEKIKQGIFKAFQARLSSPGQGGALLIAEPRNSDVKRRKNVREAKNTRTAVTQSPESDNSSSDSMSETRKRNRTRKTNFTKKKNSSKSASTGNKRQTDVNPAVSKHMRIAHGITGPSTGMKDKSMINFNLMARNRVSQKVGLINTGKKGAPASKALIIPEHISRQVDAGVKKLVQEAEADVQCTGDLDMAETMVLSKCRSASSDSNTPVYASVKAVQSTRCSVESRKNNSTPHDMNHDKFPEELPVKETIVLLLSSLKNVTKQVYPGKHYLRETQEKLLKFFKPNTPQSSTPTRTPVFHNITKSESIKRSLIELFDNQPSDQPKNRIEISTHKKPTTVQSVNSDNYQHIKGPKYRDDLDSIMTKHSHCDRVLNSLSQCREKHCHERQERSRHIFEEIQSFIDTGKLVASLNGSDGKRIKQGNCEALNLCTNRTNNLNGNHGSNQKASDLEGVSVMKRFHADYNGEDLQVLAKNRFGPQVEMKLCETKPSIDDFFLPSNKPTSNEINNSPILMWVNSVSQGEEMCSTNAQDLLQANEVKKTVPRFEPMEIEVRNIDAVNLLEKNDLLMEMSADNKPANTMELDRSLDHIGRQSRSHSQCSYSSQESSHHGSTSQKPPRRHVNYMPSFHDNYYLDHMSSGDLAWDQKTHQQKVEAMDILDYIDQHEYTGSQMDALGDRRVEVHSTASDFDSFPEWRSNSQTVQKNNVLPPPPSSPGGPMFYPMKMY